MPFWCNDYYLQSGLMFGREKDAPPSELGERIAMAFWSLLLADTHDVADYQDRMFHYGTGNWLLFGIAGGQPFIEEHETEPDG